ncbi:GDSL esterase/lipase [Melia azedarach]|uniref:GDSL esterase/lipase n=1 Tax=Melia azedarach TaxID=155640 RepID=A0ACC1XER6_MELAZ|nr:GDSL esterase/lipase [Melia azedarach]
MAFGVNSLCLLLLVLGLQQYWAHGKQQVPCYFIFGDSLVDSGNNNFLLTLAKSNYPPYGIDFPTGATGRFTNGRTTVDVIAEKLGFESYIPSFATARGIDILKGVNYASGGAGILDESGRNLGERISLNRQMQNHLVSVLKIVGILGSKDLAVNYLNKCIYTVTIGSNDYINNYFLPRFYSTSSQYNPQQYAQVLARRYAQQLMTLYSFNARKIALFGLGHIGCTPGEVAMYGTNGSSSCVEKINSAGQLFNAELKSLVDGLNKILTDANFTYINTYDMTTSIAASPAERLGYDSLIPPFASASGIEILRGVNYASGASGIRDETGKQVGQRISFNRQISNHNSAIASITGLLGNETSATAYLNKCLYSVAFGTNDYLINYFAPQLYTTSRQYTPEQYGDVLIRQYSQQIKVVN